MYLGRISGSTGKHNTGINQMEDPILEKKGAHATLSLLPFLFRGEICCPETVVPSTIGAIHSVFEY